jgi:hypothetical protein
MKKKTLFYYLLVLLTFSLVLPSCNKDDEDVPTPPAPSEDYASKVAGAYGGTLTVFEIENSGKVIMEKTATDQVSLKLDGFAIPAGITLGDINVPGIAVSKDAEGSYKLTAAQQQVNVDVNGQSTPVLVTINGTVIDKVLTLAVTAKVGIEVNVSFTGTLGAEPEAPESPETPETPETPEVPETPETPEISGDYASQVAGTYNGSINVAELPIPIPATIAVNKTADNQASLSLTISMSQILQLMPEIALFMPEMADMEDVTKDIPGVTVSKNADGSYKLTLPTTELPADEDGEVSSISLDGSVLNGSLSLKITNVDSNGGTDEMNFTGTLK